MSASTQPRSTTREKDVAAACSGRASRGRACRIKPKMRRPCAGRRLALSSSPASRRRRRRDVQVAPSPFVVDRADVASVDDRARAEAVGRERIKIVCYPHDGKGGPKVASAYIELA